MVEMRSIGLLDDLSPAEQESRRQDVIDGLLMAVSPVTEAVQTASDIGAMAFDPDLFYEFQQDPQSVGDRFAALNLNVGVPTMALGSLGRPDPNTLKVFAGSQANKFPALKGRDISIEEAEAEARGLLAEGRHGLSEPYRNVGGFLRTEREYGKGLFELPDGKLRFEIDDSQAKLRLPNFKNGNITKVIDYNNRAAPVQRLDDEFAEAVEGKNYKLGDIYEHPELFENYPQLKDINVTFQNFDSPTLGSYNPATKTIMVNVDSMYSRNVDVPTSVDDFSERASDVIVHELQHSIQDIEGFARGASTRQAPEIREKAKQDVGLLLVNKRENRDAYLNSKGKLSDASAAKSIKRYEEMAGRESIQPRALFNSSDWYKYSGQIQRMVSDELGYTYNKRKSPERDKWLRTAFKKMAMLARNENSTAAEISSELSAKEIDKRIKKIAKDMDDYSDDYRDYQKALRMASRFISGDFSDNSLLGAADHNVYENVLGEVEARAVQARRGKTLSNARGLLGGSPKLYEYPRTTFPFDQFERTKMKSPPPEGIEGTFIVE